MSPSNGFMMYSSAPASSASRMWSRSFSTVQNTTTGASPPGSWRSWRRKSRPSITGMFQSSRMASGMAVRHQASASDAVAGLGDLEAQVFQDAPRDLADHPAVVDDQAGLHGRGGLLEHPPVVAPGWLRSGGGPGANRGESALSFASPAGQPKL